TGTGPLTYQWSKDNTPISGATAATLTLTNLPLSGAGNYRVAVTNPAGTLTSSAAAVTVTARPVAPTITQQPQSQSVTEGDTVTLSLVAAGTGPLSYQWNKNGVAIPGATGSSLVFGPVQIIAAGTYTAVVSNVAGSATSSGVQLAVA